MIFYFSGTGNSQRAAIQMGEILGDEIVSMNKYLKKGEKDTFHSEDPLVFVAPTYSWQMPKVVERWILETKFEGEFQCLFYPDLRRKRGKCRRLCEKALRGKGTAFLWFGADYHAQ